MSDEERQRRVCRCRHSSLIAHHSSLEQSDMAYLTRSILEQESTWYFTAWQPQIGSQAAFDSWIDTIVTRVANHTKWRVGAALYGTTDPLTQEIPKEAELNLAQYYLCLASATIPDTSDDATTVPAPAPRPKLPADGPA